MRNRVLLAILAFLITAGALFSFVACGGDDHEHSYTVKSTDSKYLASPADCENAAKYYYSCTCGERGDVTFDHGDPVEHSYTVKSTDSKYLASPADCENAAEYYYSCICGEMDVETFVGGEPLGHDYIKHEARAANCIDIGWNEYNTCSRCNYSTYVELPKNNVHSTAYGECTVCGMPESTPGLEYSLNDDGNSYTVIGIGKCSEENIVIGIYNNKNVTAIGESAFMFCESLASVVIGDGVTSIEAQAFAMCQNLTNVSIGTGVTSIGDAAFCFTDILCNVYIKDLESWCNILFHDAYSNPLSNGNGANLYLNGELLTELIIPDGITSIGPRAFLYCESLTSVVIPDSATSIDEYAFYGCKNLETIEIPDSVVSIADSALRECFGLISITVSSGNTSYKSIDGNLYTYDGKILLLYATGKTDANFVIPDGVETIGYGALAFCRFANVVISDGVTTIGDYAFCCGSVTRIEIPDSVTSIGECAFSGCSILENVIIGNGVTAISESAFEACIRLESVLIGDGVKSIGSNAFAFCNSLTSVEIPDSVTTIGRYAFVHCVTLESVAIGNGVTSIGPDAFMNCKSLTGVYIKNLLSWCNISFEENIYFEEQLSNPLGNGAKLYLNGELVTELLIPDGVKSIGDYAFYGCTSLTSIEIPEGVISIGDSAFFGCTNLTSIEIPEDVISIGDSAFVNCICDIKYHGTKDQWDAISISEDDSIYYKMYCGIIYNYTGE